MRPLLELVCSCGLSVVSFLLNSIIVNTGELDRRNHFSVRFMKYAE